QIILTSVQWDHFNIYTTEAAYQQVFANLVASLPTKGLLLVNASQSELETIAQQAPCKVVWYRGDKPATQAAPISYYASDVQYQSNGITSFQMHTPHHTFPIEMKLFGSHNVENAVAVIGMACEWGIDSEQIQQACREFKGLKRRLELRFTHNN